MHLEREADSEDFYSGNLWFVFYISEYFYIDFSNNVKNNYKVTKNYRT